LAVNNFVAASNQ